MNSLPPDFDHPLHGEWQVEEGMLNAAEGNFYAKIAFGDTTWTDYDFTVEAMLLAQIPEQFGMIFRAPGRFRDSGIVVFGGQQVREHRIGKIGERLTISNVATKPSALIREGVWHTATVKVRGSRVQCFFNGEELFDVQHPFPPSGCVGLHLWKPKYRFRNIKVTAPDGTVLWEGMPDLASVSAAAESNTTRSEAPSATAGSSGSAGAPPTDGGWVDLFNGRDLSGWSGVTGLWKWQNGELVGTTAPDGTGYNTCLCSDRPYGDFEIEFEAKLDGAQGNSGLQIRSEVRDRPRFITFGPQVDIGAGYWGSLYGEGVGGMMKQSDAVVAEMVARPNDWNAYAVRCVGKRVTITVNGTTLVDGEFPGMSDAGVLGWQLHKGEPMTVRFRNMRIREIAPGTPSADGWTDLFNGRDFSGWVRYADGKQVKSDWVVEGNTIHHPVRPRGVVGTGDIMTTGTYDDFELEFEWKVAKGSNSGVIYRSRGADPQSYLTGPEYQILDDAGHPNGKSPKTSAASIYSLAAPSGGSLRPVGQWNTGRIIARGNHLEHWLNGKKVVEAEIGSAAWNSALAQTPFGKQPQFGKVRDGHIVLQDHRDEVWFRNLRIRDLSSGGKTSGATAGSSSSAGTTPADDSSVEMFNGRDLAGWEVADSHPAAWRVEGDSIVVGGAGQGYLFSEQDYSDFELSLEYRLEQGANSGVYLRAPRSASSSQAQWSSRCSTMTA